MLYIYPGERGEEMVRSEKLYRVRFENEDDCDLIVRAHSVDEGDKFLFFYRHVSDPTPADSDGIRWHDYTSEPVLMLRLDDILSVAEVDCDWEANFIEEDEGKDSDAVSV
jgi:hypothetical protein